MEALSDNRDPSVVEEAEHMCEPIPLNRHELARILVLNNNQLFSTVRRAGVYLVQAAVVLNLLLVFHLFGSYKEFAEIADICLLVISGSAILVATMLDRALSRCPICRARITKATERKRRCLECDTALWDYCDE